LRSILAIETKDAPGMGRCAFKKPLIKPLFLKGTGFSPYKNPAKSKGF
jgi:hypothetical protein